MAGAVARRTGPKAAAPTPPVCPKLSQLCVQCCNPAQRSSPAVCFRQDVGAPPRRRLPMLPIRRLLLRDLLVLMAGLSALLLGLSWWGQQQALERQAGARAQAALRHLDEALRIDLEASQSLGQVIHDWWLAAVLDPAQPKQ